MTASPTPFSSARRTFRRDRLRRAAAGALAIAVVGAGVAVATRGSSSPAGFRTATVGSHDVEQVLTRVATVEPVSQASVAFPVDGTVDSVRVGVGDTVAVGQSLAALDLEDLEQTVHTEQAALDQAELRLEKALDGEDVSGLGGSGGSGSDRGPTGGPSGQGLRSPSSEDADVTRSPTDALDGVGGLVGGEGAAARRFGGSATTTSTTARTQPASAGPTEAELRAAAQAVLDAQRQVDHDLAAARAALENATTVCAAVGRPMDPTAAPAEPTSTTSSPATSTTSTTTTTPGDDDLAACTAALAVSLQAQDAVAASERAVASASAAYAALVEQAAAARPPSGPSNPTTTTRPAGPDTDGSGPAADGSGGSSPSATGSNGNSSPTAQVGSTTPSAEDLVAYQKAVDAAEAALAVADQAIEQATIVSPISGTVVAVDLAVGDDVSAGSSTQRIVVVGKGGYEVTTKVPVTDLPDLERGQPATVQVDGTGRSVRGQVVAIGVLGDSSGSTTTYPVTIGLDDPAAAGLGNGGTASVSIVTASSARTLAVPTSAVRTAGTRHTVTVVEGNRARTVDVEVGAVGRTWTAVTKGLKAGQRVALADLDEPLPGSATSSDNGNRNQGPGGFRIDGGPPVGFTVGGPPGGARPGG